MTETIDWSIGTWEGNRRLRRQEFQKLSFRERVQQIEEMEAVAAVLAPSPNPPSARKQGTSTPKHK